MVQQEFFMGALTELSGPAGGGKTELVLQFLAENPTLRVAWIEEGATQGGVYPVALAQKGVSLDRVLFLECRTVDEAVWSSQQVLKSGVFEVLVLVRRSPWPEIQLRRTQLVSEKSQAFVFILGESPTEQGAWPISHQLWVRRNVSEQIESKTLKCRVWKRIAHQNAG